MFAKILHKLNAEATLYGLTCAFGASGARSPWRAPGDEPNQNELLLDDDYVDDALFCGLEVGSCWNVVRKLRALVRLVIDIFAGHALRLNFGPGKSEAMLKPAREVG